MTARFGQAFAMNVVAWSQNLTAERAEEVGATLVTKEELFRRADYISIHTRLSDRTRGLVGAPELGLMKDDACLINTSRAPIVDMNALVKVLKNSSIRAAALDVFDEEPLPVDSPLRNVENLLLTPHIGYVTRETYEIFYEGTVKAVEAFLRGSTINVVTPK